MKYSHTYLFYPGNKALERALADSIARLGAEVSESAASDSQVTVANNLLYTQGNYEQHRLGTQSLNRVREALETALTEEYRKLYPSAWAGMHISLGNVLAAQGQQYSDVAFYERALQCFNKALEEFSREKSPLDWAAAQYSLGTTMQALGRQQDDARLLKAAIDAYTNALLEWSRKEMPEEWASAMHQLGASLHAHGSLLKGNRTFQKSVVAYKNALAVLDADNHALELASAYNNCGVVLHHLAESEQSPDRLEEAIESYEKALTVSMEQQLPIHLAVLSRVNRSTARNVLAELKKDAVLADEVADEFEVIMECFPQALPPLCLNHCQEQISKAKCASA